jgi:outer membrane protein assembly factor BamB
MTGQNNMNQSIPFRASRGLSSLMKLGCLSLLVGGLVIGLAGCASKKDKNKLKGERISVLTYEQKLEADPRLGDVQVQLPPPEVNKDWPQSGGNVLHAMNHPALGSNPRKIWEASIGAGSNDRARLTSGPIVADGKVFAIDTVARVSAFDANSGKRLWSVQLKMKGEANSEAFGGGIAFDGGRIFANTGYGFVAALDAENGREIWRQEIGLPLRGSPTVSDGRVFSVTYDNQIYALSAENGSVIWNESGIAETAGILGAASPASEEGVVVAAYSSGEIFAMQAENGRTAWTDALTRTGQITALSALSDIDGDPVVDRGRVYAASHSGRMVAIDLRTGERVWERNIGSMFRLWLAGDYIYAVSTESELVCLSRIDGRIRWVRQLQRYGNQEKRKNLLDWSGPVLAGDRLIVTSSQGFALSVSPYTGEIISGMKMPGGIYIEPVVVNKTLYIVTDSGKLIAMR